MNWTHLLRNICTNRVRALAIWFPTPHSSIRFSFNPYSYCLWLYSRPSGSVCRLKAQWDAPGGLRLPVWFLGVNLLMSGPLAHYTPYTWYTDRHTKKKRQTRRPWTKHGLGWLTFLCIQRNNSQHDTDRKQLILHHDARADKSVSCAIRTTSLCLSCSFFISSCLQTNRLK